MIGQNLLSLEDDVKGMPDERLFQEMQNPNSQYPQFLVASEKQRRDKVRAEFQQEMQAKQQDSRPIVEQLFQSQMPPQQMMAQQQPAQPQMPPQMQPQATPMQPPAPQMMAAGGLVRGFSNTGYVQAQPRQQGLWGNTNQLSWLTDIFSGEEDPEVIQQADKWGDFDTATWGVPEYMRQVDTGEASEFPQEKAGIPSLSPGQVQRINIATDGPAHGYNFNTDGLDGLFSDETGTPSSGEISGGSAGSYQTEEATRFTKIPKPVDEEKREQYNSSNGMAVQGIDEEGVLSLLRKAKPNYAELIAETKSSAANYSDDVDLARNDAWSMALMQLGAGIAGGDLAEGLRGSAAAMSSGMSEARKIALMGKEAQQQAEREARELRKDEQDATYTHEKDLMGKKLEIQQYNLTEQRLAEQFKDSLGVQQEANRIRELAAKASNLSARNWEIKNGLDEARLAYSMVKDAITGKENRLENPTVYIGENADIIKQNDQRDLENLYLQRDEMFESIMELHRAAKERGMANTGAVPEVERATGNPSSVPRVTTQEDYNNLPSGAEFIDTKDGRRYRKP